MIRNNSWKDLWYDLLSDIYNNLEMIYVRIYDIIL